jgi:uncharacterized protein (TIGR00290 family)
MPNRPKALLAWSSGKDSAWALHVLRSRGECDVVGLLTTINEAVDRVAMHAVRRELLEAQARAAGLPLWPVPIPWPCPNGAYEERMASAVARAHAEGIQLMAFGDLYLEEVRKYREEKMAGTGITPIFPLWGLDTKALAREMLASGVKAILTCVDPKQLPADQVGREFDAAFLDSLPTGADPCAEKGEFHTFCYAAPCFSHPIPVQRGEIVERDGFTFCDLLHSECGG